MKRFTKLKVNKDTLASILLFAGVVAALVISNHHYLLKHYRTFINYDFYIGLGNYQLSKPILKWVKDG